MDSQHIALMLRSRADKYGSKEVFRYKKNDSYQSVSWNEFKRRAEVLSKYLLSIGVEVSDNIGILSYNRPEWTIADLAVLSVRGVVVPLYTTGSLSQISYIINETQMSVLFVGNDQQLTLALEAMEQSDSLKLIVAFDDVEIKDDRVVSYNDISNMSSEEEDLQFKQRLKESDTDDLATIVYTSGTTGEPKGVMLHHRNFVHSFKIHVKRLILTDKDVSLCFLPLSHVFERAWSFFVLYNGCVNVYNPNPKHIMEEISLVKPTVMCVIPRFFEKVYQGIITNIEKAPIWKRYLFNRGIAVGLKYIEYEKNNVRVPLVLQIQRMFYNKIIYSKLRAVFGGQINYMPCAGAALRKDLLKFFHAIGIYINYGYGCSETTATVSCMPQKNYDFDFTGRILSGIEVKISEENMILVKGGTVFSGYYKKPEETAQVLKDGWYYTGDKGYIAEDGKLLMTERIKDIIKTSTGKYISPQKIELLLQKSDVIEQICVFGDDRKFITALIVPCFAALKAKLQEANLTFNKLQDMLSCDEIMDLMMCEINKLQQELPTHERVVKMKLLNEPFSIKDETMTTTLKLRRKQIGKLFQTEIDALYL